MSQPSAQGIASLFRGNPAPLQQRIQQEQQGKPGLPPDLHELMALNIVTNETDAMAKQKAMDQLAQMQGPQGKPPTVMDSVREQARQKMEAQAVQAQQQQQGLQALMQQVKSPQVPENTPQPEAQPQGLDDLPVEFGLAGGGIVAFKKGGDEGEEYETPYDRMNRRNREEEERRRRDLEAFNEQLRKDPAQVKMREEEQAFEALSPAERSAERGRKLKEFFSNLVASPPAAVVQAPMATPMTAPGRPAAPEVSDRRLLNQADAGLRSAPPAPKPVADLKALAAADARKQQQKAPRPPVEEAAPTPAASSVMPPPQSEVNRFLTEEFQRDPQAGAANKETMYGSRVGPYDPTQRDAMIKQLQDERARQVGPQDSFGQLMEYLGQIAATPRGMTSFEAGAAGARGVRGLDEQRAQKRFDLGSKIIEQEQGKIDGARAYAKELYGVGEKEFDRIYNAKLEAAKRLSTDEMEVRKLAQQETLKTLEMAQQATLRREEMRSNEKIAGMRGAGGMSGESKEIAAAEAAFARDPEAAALKKQLESPIFANNPAKAAGVIKRLRDIQASKYAQFGIKMEPAPGAESLGGNRPPLSSFQR